MILNKIIIKNMFSYEDIELDLKPDGKKNIILIGARNGQGKTSFLRILRILLHGIRENSDFTKADMNLSAKKYILGDDKSWDGLFNKITNSKTASVEGFFIFDNREIIIKRIFKNEGDHYLENMTIKDGHKIINNNEDFIERIIPKNLAQFFIFDGEKIENIINYSNPNLTNSLEILLNIEPYNKLIDTLKKLRGSIRKETKDIEGIEKIESKRSSLINKETLIESNNIKINNSKKILNELKEDNDELKSLKSRLSHNKNNSISYDELKEKIKKSKEIIQADSLYIKTNIKSNNILFLIIENIIRVYDDELAKNDIGFEKEEQLKTFKRTLNAIISNIQNNVFDPDIKDIPREVNLSLDQIEFYQDRIKEEANKSWNSYKNKKQKKINERNIYFIDEDKEKIKNIFEAKKLFLDKIKSIKKEKEILNKNESEMDDFDHSDQKNGQRILELKNKIEDLDYQIGLKEVEISELTFSNKAFLNDILKDKDFISVAESNLKFSDKLLKKEKLIEHSLSFLSSFKKELLSKKIKILELEFNNFIQELSFDKEWIREVYIDDSLNITIEGYHQNNLKLSSLSSGEKQIISTALIQAINSVSKVKSFMCIDTPLARIDKENRKQFIENYYPRATKQIILLSTNTEIILLEDDHLDLDPFISKYYTIYSEKGIANIKNGYFEEDQ